jgi:AcrR family transcriptional regulator
MSDPAGDAPDARHPRGGRGSLSQVTIVTAALELAEEVGVDRISMPRLGRHLGVAFGSIYWYFKSKDALLDAMTDAAMGRFYELMPEINTTVPWDEMLREYFVHWRRIWRENDVLCDLIVMRPPRQTTSMALRVLRVMEPILQRLVEAGFEADDAAQGYFNLSVYARGCVILERNSRAAGRTDMLLATLDGDPSLRATFPIMSDETRLHSFSMVEDDDFLFGLDNILRGMRSQLAATMARSSRGRSGPSRSRTRRPPTEPGRS